MDPLLFWTLIELWAECCLFGMFSLLIGNVLLEGRI